MSDAPQAGLREIAHKWWTPDPKIVAKLPKGGDKNKDNWRNCRVCGGWHATNAAHLDFVGHADLTRAFIEIDDEWQWEPVAFDENGLPRIVQRGNNWVLWGRVTLLGKTMLAVGTCETSKGEADKELVGDMLRNAGMRFGIFGSLWSKTDGWDDENAVGGAEHREGSGGAGETVTASPSATSNAPDSSPRPLPPVDIAQPDKPLAAMTMRELLDFARACAVSVSGSKSDIVRTLEPLVRAASGDEPWELKAKPLEGECIHGIALAVGCSACAKSVESERPEFVPVVADAADGSATARKQRDAINKTVREG